MTDTDGLPDPDWPPAPDPPVGLFLAVVALGVILSITLIIFCT